MEKMTQEELEKETLIAIINCKYRHNNIPTNGQLTDAISKALSKLIVETVECECGHTVPLEFSVSDTEDGNATCMPCFIESLDIEAFAVDFQNFCFTEGWKQMEVGKFQKDNWKNMSGTNKQNMFCTSKELWSLFRVKLAEAEEDEQ